MEITKVEKTLYNLCVAFLFENQSNHFHANEKVPDPKQTDEDNKNRLDAMESIRKMIIADHHGETLDDEITKFQDDPKKIIKVTNSVAELLVEAFGKCASPLFKEAPEGTKAAFIELGCDTLAKVCPR